MDLWGLKIEICCLNIEIGDYIKIWSLSMDLWGLKIEICCLNIEIGDYT